MSNLNNDGFFQAIAAEKEAKKPGKAMAWYLQHWKPGKADSDLAFMTGLLQEPILKFQTWTNEVENLVFKAKEFSLTIRPMGGLANIQRFLISISSVQDVTLWYREFFLNPTFLEEGVTGLREMETQKQFANILELWKLKQPVEEFDPFEL